MWAAQQTEAIPGTALRYAVTRGGEAMTFLDVIAAWEADDEFARWFGGVLEAVPFPAFRWETPGITAATASRAFEFVVFDSPELEQEGTPDPFREHFDGGSVDEIVTFSNLGGDAILVVPRPIAASSAYGHIGAFVRTAPDPQRLALWKSVGRAMRRRISARPVWLSTAGAGVAWLHVRLDDRPKYYAFAPFRARP
jgi:hypothetical protein